MSTRTIRRSRLLMTAIGVTVSATVAACSSASTSQPTAQQTAPAATAAPQQTVPGTPGAPWTAVFSDSFNGPLGQGIDQSKWNYQVGQGIFGTGEVERTTSSPANIRLDGHGHLDIVALHDSSGWTSARIKTNSSSFGAPAGGEMMVTASIKQPDPANATGYWPGFWLLGPDQWPETGEIDILEDVDSSSEMSGTLHCGNLSQRNPDGTTGPCHETAGLGSGLRPCPGCGTGYHAYSVIVDRRSAADQQIRWYFDGREYYSLDESSVGAAAWTQGVDHGFQIILDVAIGGGYPDGTCRCQSPARQTSSGAVMSVAGVGVYYLKPA